MASLKKEIMKVRCTKANGNKDFYERRIKFIVCSFYLPIACFYYEVRLPNMHEAQREEILDERAMEDGSNWNGGIFTGS